MHPSPLDPAAAAYRRVVPAGEPWIRRLSRGQVLRLVDLEGNQSADTMFYDADDPHERYSASDTIRRQAALYLTAGSQLVSNAGNVMLTVVADTCGRHDTLGGACSRESNTMRYGAHAESMHACRESFLIGAQSWHPELGKRDLTCNVNFFMNVPVTPDGRLTFADGVSGPGRYVELRAERDVVVLISNCPQLNNPCNAYNPTPIEAIIWDPACSPRS